MYRLLGEKMAQETQTAAGQVLYYVVMVLLSTLGVSFAAWSLHLARARARRELSSSALAAGKPTTHSSTYLLE